MRDRTDRRAAVAAALVVVAAIALAWSNAWPGTFQFDDYAVIVDEPRVHTFAAWWSSLPGLRPLLKASYLLSWHVGAANPAAFTAFNLCVHVVNALLVFALAHALLPMIGKRLGAHDPRTTYAALATALVFALHPAQTESVTYLSGRSTSLMALFWLAALVAWLRGTRRARAAALLLFVAAMATKETAASWPFVVLLVEAVRGGRWREALRTARAPFVVAGGCLIAAALLPIYQRLAVAGIDARGPLANLAAQVDGVAYLIGQPLLSLRTNIDPAIDVTAFAAGWWIKAALLTACGWYALASLRPGAAGELRRPLAGFAIGWFVLAIAPTNSLLARFDIANDRELYLAIVGPALAIGVAVARWRHAAVPVALLLVVLASATFVRNRDYVSEVALWQATARASPAKSRVFNNLGYALARDGRDAEARTAFERALALDAGDYKARVNLLLLGETTIPAVSR